MSHVSTVIRIRIRIIDLINQIQQIETDRSIGRPIYLSEGTDWVDCLQSAEAFLRDAYGELGAVIEALGVGP